VPKVGELSPARSVEVGEEAKKRYSERMTALMTPSPRKRKTGETEPVGRRKTREKPGL
jgi:hypothetical protein